MNAPRADTLPRLPALILIALMGVFIVVNVAGLADYPLPYCDETQHIATARSFFEHGTFSVDYFGELVSYKQNLPTLGRTYLITKGLLLEALGYTYLVGRLYTTLGWLAAGVCVFLTGRKLINAWAGLVSAAIFMSSSTAYYYSHYGRPEMWAAAFSVGLLYYYLVIRDQPTRLRFLFFGLLGGLAIDFHPTILLFALPLALLAIFDQYRAGEGRLRLALAALGGLSGAALVAVSRLVPDPAAALEHMRFAGRFNDLTASTASEIGVIKGLIFYRGLYLSNMGGVVIVFTLYLIAGFAYLSWKRPTGTKHLLVMWGVSMAAFFMLMAHKNWFYEVLWEPLSSLVVGAAGVALAGQAASFASARWGRAVRPEAALLILLAPLFAANLAAQVWMTLKFSPRDVPGYIASIQASIPPGPTLYGNMTLAPAFHDRNPFLADSYIRYCLTSGECQNLSEQDELNLLAGLDPDYIIYDGRTGCDDASVRSERIQQYAETSCILVTQIDNPWFGLNGNNIQGHPTLIYRCDTP